MITTTNMYLALFYGSVDSECFPDNFQEGFLVKLSNLVLITREIGISLTEKPN